MRCDLGKVNFQLVADEKNEDRAERRKYEPGRVIAFVCRTREYVSDGATEDRSDDPEDDRPEKRDVGVHRGSRNQSCDQPNEDIPDEVKHVCRLSPATKSARTAVGRGESFHPSFGKESKSKLCPVLFA